MCTLYCKGVAHNYIKFKSKKIMSHSFGYYIGLDTLLPMIPLGISIALTNILLVGLIPAVLVIVCKIFCCNEEQGDQEAITGDANSKSSSKFETIKNALYWITVKIAQYLYGIKSVQWKENKLKYRYRCLKINGNYYELGFGSILPIVWCNINVLGLLLAAFIAFVVQVQTTYTCTTELDCFNTTGYEPPNFTTPTLIDDCFLFNDTDNVICFEVSYEFATALGLVGGFLLTVPRLAFGILTFIHNKLIIEKSKKQEVNCACSCKCFIHYIAKSKIIMWISTILWTLIYYGVYIYFVIKTDPQSKKKVNKALSNNSQEQIVIGILIFAIFLSCPFNIMGNKFKEKSDAKKNLHNQSVQELNASQLNRNQQERGNPINHHRGYQNLVDNNEATAF